MKKSALYVFFFLSGLAGLGYEILWTRMFAVSLGHEIISVLAVLGGFFGGLALGAWVLDRPVSRSAEPGKWLASFELIIGLWGLCLIFLLPQLNGSVAGWIGETPSWFRHWSISFLYPLILLLPATVSMGGTLPAMDRFFERIGRDGQAVAGLYSVNTLGAGAGTLLVTFWILPSFGMRVSGMTLVMVNFFVAAGLFILAFGKPAAYRSEAASESISLHTSRIYAVLFITGLLGTGFEVLIVRALSQILENTVFSFAFMLVVFLLGTALGAGIYQRIKKSVEFENGLSVFLLSTAVLSLISIFLLQYIEPLFHTFLRFTGDGLGGAVIAEMAVSSLIFLLPTLSMGATFSHLALSLKGRSGGVGRALCLNTLGGAVAPLLFGVILLPGVGLRFSLLLLAVLYIPCIPKFRWKYAYAGIWILPLALYIGLNPEIFRLVSLEPGEELVFHEEGIMASVSVIKDSGGAHHLKVNNHFQMGGTTSTFSDRRQAYLPLLLHPNPKQALFLGLGSGATFSAAADFGNLNAEGVELVPEVIAAMPYFEKATGDFSKFDNLHVFNADARRFVQASRKKYDVIVADLFHPSRDGAGSLYTVEHFRALSDLLSEDGIFCQWLPLYQLDLDTFKTITRTFLNVFSDGQAYLAHYSIDQPIIGLMGGNRELRYPERWYRNRLSNPGARRLMSSFGYDSVYSLLGTFLAGSEELRDFAGEGALNSDAHPVVIFQAPRFVYKEPEPAKERLLALLKQFKDPDPESILAEIVTEDDNFARDRLARYWKARDSYLELGARISRTNDPEMLYRTASDPLLKVVRKSVDFSAAYFPLLSIAYEIYPMDRDASYKLLMDLERANPMRPEATVLRKQLFDN